GNVTQEVQGAGINGTFEAVAVGYVEAMTMTMNFRTVTKKAIQLAEPRNHNLDLRAAQQEHDTRTGLITQAKVKHVVVAQPKKLNLGKLAQASPGEVNGEYAVSYLATYINGEKMIEIDILNYIYFINGTDYLAEVRKALGK
ncbi:MAG: phage major tail tube protein, partial [Acidaminococcaceae bacterium]